MLQRVKSLFRSSMSGRMVFIYAVVLFAFFGISSTACAVNIYVETCTKTWGTIVLEKTDVYITVSKIKKIINNKTGIPVEWQHLIKATNGKELNDTATVSSFIESSKILGRVTLRLIVDDRSYPPAPEPTTVPVYEEPVFYALPEDEIGAYALRDDGTKEYLLFHTYDICMDWLASDELCSGFERCFHKDGK